MRDRRGVAEVTVHERASKYDTIVFVRKVKRTDRDRSFDVLVGTRIQFGIGLTEGIAERVAAVSAEAQSKSFYTRVIDTCRTREDIRQFELIGTAGTGFDPVLTVEAVAVQAGQKHRLIMPAVLGTAHEGQGHFMPGRRDDGELAFVTIDTEILGRFVVRIQSSDRDDLHTGADDRIAVERFLQPELLKCHFTSAFDLGFVLTAFFFLYLDR